MIYIPFNENTRGIGGPSTFMRNLKEYLLKADYPFTDDSTNYRNADCIFFPISFSSRILDFFKKNDLPIIQRLDGVYYPSKHGIKYIYLNREIKKDYLKYSDFVIFQSKYSRTECFTMLGEIDKSRYKIIYNGTDKDVFYPAEKKFNKEKIIFTTTGSFRNRDMIEPVVLALDVLAKKRSIELRVIGPISNREVIKLTNRPYVKCVGKMDKKEVAGHLQKTDILIHCQLNPACPNSVIEAVSCGVPVVGFDTGAMEEVLYFAPELLAYVSDDVFKEYKDFKYERLLDKIILCIENYGMFKRKFSEHNYLYDFRETYKQYVEIFKIVLKGKVRKSNKKGS
jgi:glycosyltransferase involved in cell wall biosynthesis